MNRMLVAFCLSSVAHAAIAAETLTAINMDPDWAGINGWAWYIGYSGSDGYINEAAAQEFVTSVSGKLTTLEATVDKFSGGAPLVITFREAVANRPGAVLGSVAIPPESIGRWTTDSPSRFNTFDVSAANVTVEAGRNYFVTFTTPIAGAVRYRAILVAPNDNSFGYRALYSKDGGATWVYPNITPEIGMRLYVESVEPPPPVEYEVEIDVLADTSKTAIQLGKRKPKPLEVLVFGNSDVSVEEMIDESLGLGDPTIDGGAATGPFHVVVGDWNGDGLADLSLLFDLTAMEANGSIDAESVALELRGLLMSGDSIVGLDLIDLSPPNGKGNNGKDR